MSATPTHEMQARSPPHADMHARTLEHSLLCSPCLSTRGMRLFPSGVVLITLPVLMRSIASWEPQG